MAEVLNSPRYVCWEKSSGPSWLFTEITALMLFWGIHVSRVSFTLGVASSGKSLESLEKFDALASFTTLPFCKGIQDLQSRAGMSPGKFTIFKNLIPTFSVCLSVGVTGLFFCSSWGALLLGTKRHKISALFFPRSLRTDRDLFKPDKLQHYHARLY